VSCKNTFLHFAELRNPTPAGFSSPMSCPINRSPRRRFNSDITDLQAVFIPSPLMRASASPRLSAAGSPSLLPVDEAACTHLTTPYDGSMSSFGDSVIGGSDFILPPPCDDFGPCEFTFTLDGQRVVDDHDFDQGIMGVQMAHAVFGTGDDCDEEVKTRATRPHRYSNHSNDSNDWGSIQGRKTASSTTREASDINDWKQQRDDKKVRERRQKQRRKGNKIRESLQNAVEDEGSAYHQNFTPKKPAAFNTNNSLSLQARNRQHYTKNSHSEIGVKLPKGTTTVMLRNIPNKYTRQMLIRVLNENFNGMYDFMYLPIDFKNKCNVGYGFLNMRTPEMCAQLATYFHGVDVRRCLPGFNSKKICEVTPARVQGLQDNVRRLQNSPVMAQLKGHPEWLPVLFGADGGCKSFPCAELPTKSRTKSD